MQSAPSHLHVAVRGLGYRTLTEAAHLFGPILARLAELNHGLYDRASSLALYPELDEVVGLPALKAVAEDNWLRWRDEPTQHADGTYGWGA